MDKLNDTLLNHLHPKTQIPKNRVEERALAVRAERKVKERALAVRAERNVIKRAEINHAEDVLDARELIDVVNHLLEYYGRSETPPSPEPGFSFGNPGRVDEINLRWQIRYGLLVPQYLLGLYDKTGKRRRAVSVRLPNPRLVFNDGDHLQKIAIQRCCTKQYHRLQWYKKEGFLVARPDAAAVLKAWPRLRTRGSSHVAGEVRIYGYRASGIVLFAFRQALHVLAVHRLLYSTHNWLGMSPTEYQRTRVEVLYKMQDLVREDGAPPLRLCKVCWTLLPVVGPEQEFCSSRCGERWRNTLKRYRRLPNRAVFL